MTVGNSEVGNGGHAPPRAHHLVRMSAPLRMKNDTVCPALLQLAASARASSVLPVPGGPYSSTPLGGFRWNRSKTSG